MKNSNLTLTEETLDLAEATSNPEKFQAIILHIMKRTASLKAPKPVIKKIRGYDGKCLEYGIPDFLTKEVWDIGELECYNYGKQAEEFSKMRDTKEYQEMSYSQQIAASSCLYSTILNVSKGTRELSDGMGWYKERSCFASIAFGEMVINNSTTNYEKKHIELALVHYGVTGLSSDGKTGDPKLEIHQELDLTRPLEELIEQVEKYFRFKDLEEELEKYTPEMIQEAVEESKKLVREKREEKKAKLQNEIEQLQEKLKKLK
jgi:hypothetical protein